jgi:hypothetical protein
MNTGLVGFVKVAYPCVCNRQLSKLTTMRLPKRSIPRESLYKLRQLCIHVQTPHGSIR